MAELTTPEDCATISTRPRMSVWQQASLSIYWFATQALWSATLMALLPLQAIHIGGADHKGATLGAIVLPGALVSMLVAPLFGAWSDRVHTRWGRRKPFLVYGTIANALALVLMAFIPSTRGSLIPFAFVFVLIELFNNVATAPYAALIPDVVPKAQRGSASGWMGLMSMLGTALGAVTGLLVGNHLGRVPFAYIGLAVLMVLGMLITVLTVKEPAPPKVPPFNWANFARGLVEPFHSDDFRWVFLTRMLIVLGTFTVQEFVQYYMRDVVANGAVVGKAAENYIYTFFHLQLARSAPAATSIFLLALLVGAVASSLVAGILSDRYGRKRMVYLSGGLQGLVVMVFVFSGSFEVAVFMGIVFGLGYGAYQAVDWALASDVLPKEDDYAKDMGVWHVASTFPQVIAVPIAGLLLDNFQRIGQSHHLPTLGYTVIFMLAFVYYLLGTVLVKKVKGTS